MDNKNEATRGLDHIGDVLAFVRVADAQSFTVAAERLGLSRSAIGKCIGRLEQNLGVRLLHRSTRNVSLSDEGRLFYEHAQRILSEVENATDAMASRKQSPRGRLRIDLPVSLGRLHVMPLLREYLRRWPDVEADVSFSDDYVDLIRDGIDVAIRIGGDTDSRLVRKVLAPHRLIVCAAPDYLDRHGAPETPDDLARHRSIAFTHAGALVPWRFSANGQEARAAGGRHTQDGQYRSLARRCGWRGTASCRSAHTWSETTCAPAGLRHCWKPGLCLAPPYARCIRTGGTWRPRSGVLIDDIAARWNEGAPWGHCAQPPRA